MKKQCQFVLLPTSELSKKNGICDTAYGFAISGKDGVGTEHHLYILSDDEIKDGRENFWTYDHLNKKPLQIDYINYFGNDNNGRGNPKNGRASFKTVEGTSSGISHKEIIATTNSELTDKWKKDKGGEKTFPQIPTPSISQSDIEYIISKYNGFDVPNRTDKELIGMIKGKEVDVEKLAKKHIDSIMFQEPDLRMQAYNSFKAGYKCLQDNANKKFTLEDMATAVCAFAEESVCDEDLLWHDGNNNYVNAKKWLNNFILSLTKKQPKSDTVMVEYEIGYEGALTLDGSDKVLYPKPKLKDGCIVIVRD